MTKKETEDLARLAHACAKPLRVRVMTALIELKGKAVSLDDLTKKVKKLDKDATIGDVYAQANILTDDAVVGLKKTGPTPSEVSFWITDGGVFDKLARLASKA